MSRSRDRKTIRILRDFDHSLFMHHPSEDLRVDMERLHWVERMTIDWPRSGSEPCEPGSNPNPNLMFEVRFSQIIEPEPKRRFRFSVSANLNIRLRTRTFFQGENLERRCFLHT